MTLLEKYQPARAYCDAIGIQVSAYTEENGRAIIVGMAPTEYVKGLLFTKFREVAGHNDPQDVGANIGVTDGSVFHRHTVEKGESLSLIAKHYYGEANKYMKIFEANRNLLDDPNKIFPDQVLVIPFE